MDINIIIGYCVVDVSKLHLIFYFDENMFGKGV